MGQIRSKRWDEPDEVRRFEYMDSSLIEIGSIPIGRAVLSPGWRWSTSIGPVSGDTSCQVHHIQMILSGRIRFEMDDGETAEFGPDTVVEVPPGHDAWVVGAEPVVLIDFAGNVAYVGVSAGHQRVVTTILMSDIVNSTATAARLGDVRWRQLLAEHNRVVRSRFERFGAREINTTGDGFIAMFASAIGALRCAAAITADVASTGVQVRVGIHTGEVELVGDDVRGVAVHEAARIMSLAWPSEVLVSGITRTLVEGGGLAFEDRGDQQVKGFDKPIHVYALTT